MTLTLYVSFGKNTERQDLVSMFFQKKNQLVFFSESEVTYAQEMSFRQVYALIYTERLIYINRLLCVRADRLPAGIELDCMGITH